MGREESALVDWTKCLVWNSEKNYWIWQAKEDNSWNIVTIKNPDKAKQFKWISVWEIHLRNYQWMKFADNKWVANLKCTKWIKTFVYFFQNMQKNHNILLQLLTGSLFLCAENKPTKFNLLMHPFLSGSLTVRTFQYFFPCRLFFPKR